MFPSNRANQDLPCSGHLRVTTPGKDRYIMNMRLCNCFSIATVAHTSGTRNNSISAQTVCNRLGESGL